MIASSVMLLSLVLGGAVDAEVPSTPPPLPPPTVPSHHDAATPQLQLRPPGEVPAPSRTWYGWQLLLADAASFTLGITGKTGVLGAAGTLGFTLGAPAIHFAHGNGGTAMISLLVRSSMVGVALYGGSWQGTGQENCHDDLCRKQLDDVLPGLIFLAAGAVFVVADDTLLARADAPSGPAAVANARWSGTRFALAPTLAPTSGGMSMGLVGRF